MNTFQYFNIDPVSAMSFSVHLIVLVMTPMTVWLWAWLYITRFSRVLLNNCPSFRPRRPGSRLQRLYQCFSSQAAADIEQIKQPVFTASTLECLLLGFSAQLFPWNSYSGYTPDVAISAFRTMAPIAPINASQMTPLCSCRWWLMLSHAFRC